MPLPMATSSTPPPVPSSDYPAVTKQAAGIVDGKATDIISTQFTDKIMITITQDGRLVQWVKDSWNACPNPQPSTNQVQCNQVQVSLDAPNPNLAEQYLPAGSNEDSLLPLSHLTPRTLLGGSTSEREIVGQLYATKIASAIITRNPEETRTILLGLGLSKLEANRESFYDTIDLVLKCL